MSETPRILRRIVPRQEALTLWGVIAPRLPLAETLPWLERWRHHRRSAPDFHPDQLAVLHLSDVGSSQATSRLLARFRDLLPHCLLTGDDRVLAGLDGHTRAFPNLRTAGASSHRLERRLALLVTASEVEDMTDDALAAVLRTLNGRPLLLANRPSDPTFDWLRNQVRDQDVVVVPDKDPEPVSLLFLQAQAPGRPSLDLEAERSAIGATVRASFAVESATTLERVGHALALHRPRVLHFGGHGDDGFLWFEGRGGVPHRETGERLAGAILAAVGPDALPELIVLNACESEAFVDDLARVCRNLVVMDRKISDRAAHAFAAGFYRALTSSDGNDLRMKALPEAVVVARRAMAEVDAALAEAAVWIEGKAAAVVSVEPPGAAGLDIERGSPETIVRVWWGTDRKPVDAADPSAGFGTEPDGNLRTGSVEVSVARGPYGEIDGGGLSRRRRVRTIDGSLRGFASPEDFTADLASGLAAWSRAHDKHPKQSAPELLVFVHGYNVGFDEAARRAAQIHVDLRVPGVTAFYSWASADRLTGYLEDENSVVHAIPHLQTFLEALLNVSGVGRFHLLAHSMGNRALLWALENVARRAGERTGKPFGQIFLCAPDVAPDRFARVASALPALAERTTLYISREDRALQLSKLFHGRNRIGLYPEVTVVEGVDTIAAEEVSGALLGLGHGYYARAEALLHDLHSLVLQDMPPSARPRLHAEPDASNPRYYSFGF